MINDEIQYCIKVNNAFKSYGSYNVFKNLNMKVKSGSIYGLLGPSGCGKSTLLQCILGTKSFDSGHIDLDVASLKDVGYMPQDLCLEETLTIKELFEYYGTLYNMTKENIEKKMKELNKFLQLPNSDISIKSISGGQGRRVSLGISLLHDPKVIVLDEPTVGIDPLLRQNIWNELTKMVDNQQKTIIITTHYIEEANQANFIGLMRNGEIIKEGSPQDIISDYNSDSLESAFLMICCNQETNKIVRCKDVHETDVSDEIQSKKLTIKLDEKIDLHRIKVLLKKNGRIFIRDYLLLFTVLLLPIIQAFNLCASVGVDFKGMKLAIKSDEINFVDCKYFNVSGCIFDENNNQTQSCIVMNYLETLGYVINEMNDRDAGEMIMENTNSIAFIHFPKNFTKNLAKFIDKSDDYDNQSKAYVHYTKENVLFRNKIVNDVTKAMRYALEKTLIGCSNNPKASTIPMKFITLTGKEVKMYVNSIVAVFLGIGTFYFASIYSVSTMLSEKMDGFFNRSKFAGVTVLELHISMFCIATMSIVVQSLFSCMIAYVFFSNPIDKTNGLLMYALIMMLLGWLGFFFGLLTAGISPTKTGGAYMMTGWAFFQFILSGGLWPVEGQPLILRSVSELLPLRVASKAMNNIALKGWTWNNPSVLMDTSVTILYIILLVLVLFGLGKWKKNTWVLNN